jgi:ADP-ribose pyrophosphatase
METTNEDQLLESLAQLEHEQWASWARCFLSNKSEENQIRWQRQMETPYEDLTDDEKEADRFWARKVLACTHSNQLKDGTLFEGRFLRVKVRRGWEYVERRKISGVVAILAVTEDGKVIMIEQFRPPIGKRILEIPAGLAGDIAGEEDEGFPEAARRELLEETGYRAESMELLTQGPASAGLSNEIITFYQAKGLTKVAKGGGEGSESILVHEVPLVDLNSWIAAKRSEGCEVDYKVFTALYFLGRKP